MNTKTLLYKKNTPIKFDRIGVLLVFFLIAVSGIEYFYQSQYYILLAFFFSTFIFIREKKKINKSFVFIISLFLIIESLQYVLYGGFNLWTFSGSYIRLFLAFSVLSIVGKNFFEYYVKVIYFLCTISLLFYIGSFLPGAEGFYTNVLSNLIPNPLEKTDGFYKSLPNIVLFTFNGLFPEHRNSGPFWEPGAFSVFIMIALLFNHIQEKNLTAKKNIVFVASLITTFSTAGYVAFFVFIFYINIDLIKKKLIYTIVFIIVLFSSYYLYENTPFLKDKIVTNISLADETTTSRFGSAKADLDAFTKSPIVGFGRAGAKQGFVSSSDFSVENHRNNGIFDLLAKYGLPLTIIYFYLIFKTFFSIKNKYSISKYYPFAAFIIILLLGFSQGLFLKPFFYSFLFLPSFLMNNKTRYIENFNSNTNI